MWAAPWTCVHSGGKKTAVAFGIVKVSGGVFEPAREEGWRVFDEASFMIVELKRL